MAKKYRWPTDPPGKPPSHSISWEQHQRNLAAAAQQRAQDAAAGATAESRARAMTQAQGGQMVGGVPVPPAPTLPPPPAPVAPFFTAEDLLAINDFNTRYASELANIDASLENLRIDTEFQKTRLDEDAKRAESATTDSMIARGLFRSSIKDAALYDIEAQRALQQKFLEDKFTTAKLNAGTQKKLLAESKSNFDKAMAQRKLENAQRINEANNQAWSSARADAERAFAEWQQKYGQQKRPEPTPPPTPSIKAPAPPPATLAAGPGIPGTKVKQNKKKRTVTYYAGVTTP